MCGPTQSRVPSERERVLVLVALARRLGDVRACHCVMPCSAAACPSDLPMSPSAKRAGERRRARAASAARGRGGGTATRAAVSNARGAKRRCAASRGGALDGLEHRRRRRPRRLGLGHALAVGPASTRASRRVSSAIVRRSCSRSARRRSMRSCSSSRGLLRSRLRGQRALHLLQQLLLGRRRVGAAARGARAARRPRASSSATRAQARRARARAASRAASASWRARVGLVALGPRDLLGRRLSSGHALGLLLEPLGARLELLLARPAAPRGAASALLDDARRRPRRRCPTRRASRPSDPKTASTSLGGRPALLGVPVLGLGRAARSARPSARRRG